MKHFLVHLEFMIDSVSCPGVRLCNYGGVWLRIRVGGYKVFSKEMPPFLPIKFHERIYFTKTYDNLRSLQILERQLSNEQLVVELFQNSIKLARFEGVMKMILSIQRKVNLLLTPLPKFPGILSPQLTMSGKMRIEERKQDKIEIPLVLSSLDKNRPGPPRYQKTVCHSPNYHRLISNVLEEAENHTLSGSWSSLEIHDSNAEIHKCHFAQYDRLTSKVKEYYIDSPETCELCYKYYEYYGVGGEEDKNIVYKNQILNQPTPKRSKLGTELHRRMVAALQCYP